MRGLCLHSYKDHKIRADLAIFPVRLYPECRICRNGVTGYFDFGVKGGDRMWAIEIETTIRHLVDNAKKAAAVNIPLWIVVPTCQIRKQAALKLRSLNLLPGGEPIKLLLVGQVQKEVANYLSFIIPANIGGDK
jgi:hypothetical protein